MYCLVQVPDPKPIPVQIAFSIPCAILKYYTYALNEVWGRDYVPLVRTIDMSACGAPSNFQTYLYFHGPLTNFPPSQITQCQQWYISYHGYMKVNWLLFCMRQLSCGGWWLSGYRGSVAEHWQLKPEVPWVRLPAAAMQPFHFPLFSPHNIRIHLFPA